MKTIYEIAKYHNYSIIRINENKGYFVLKVEGNPCKIMVHFDLIPVKALLEFMSEIDLSPDRPQTCKESGGRYGIIA